MTTKPVIDFGKLWDWIEQSISVTLLKLQANESFVPYTVANVLEIAGSEDELILSNVKIESSVKIFHLWREMLEVALPGLRPYKGDQIKVDKPYADEDATYTIRRVQTMNRGLRFRCICIENLVGKY